MAGNDLGPGEDPGKPETDHVFEAYERPRILLHDDVDPPDPPPKNFSEFVKWLEEHVPASKYKKIPAKCRCGRGREQHYWTQALTYGPNGEPAS